VTTFLERLRGEPKPAATGTAKATSGRGHISGFIVPEELNTRLVGTAGLRIFDRMWRTDSDVRKALTMLINPIAGATWTIEPYGGFDATDEDKEIAKFVQWALFENMRPQFASHLYTALRVSGRCGFAPFYYRVGAEGDNWEGVSLLRPVYKNWYLKDKIERLDAIAQEREAVGLPVIYPPSALTDKKALDEMEKKLQRLRAGEQAYLIMPGPRAQDMKENAGTGWHFELVGFGSGSSGGAGRDAQPSLQYHSDKIAAGFIEEFMRLGQKSTGARATAQVQQDPFQ
jgi:hypothetical protein